MPTIEDPRDIQGPPRNIYIHHIHLRYQGEDF